VPPPYRNSRWHQSVVQSCTPRGSNYGRPQSPAQQPLRSPASQSSSRPHCRIVQCRTVSRLAVGEKGQGLSMPHCFRPGVNLSGQSMSGLAELDNAPSTTTCGEVSIHAPQQTHAFPMPHLSRTGNNPHPLSRARADANRALHPLPRSRPQRARDSLDNARSSLATQSSQTRSHERMVRPLEEPALVLWRASLTRLRVQMRRWLSP
jgi:hypothetical protein